MHTFATQDPPGLDLLPQSLREIAEAIGDGIAQKLMKEFAGIRAFIPKRLAPGHRLIRLLGEEDAKRLSHHFGGETLFIPRGAKAERARRNQEIVAGYDSGTPVRTLAQKHNLTERQIYSIGDFFGTPSGQDLSWRPVSGELAVARSDATIIYRQVSTGFVETNRLGAASTLSWSPDGSKLALAHANVVILDGESFATLAVLPSGGCKKLLWSPDGSKLACIGDSDLSLYDSQDFSIRRQINTTGASQFTWSKDGHYALYAKPLPCTEANACWRQLWLSSWPNYLNIQLTSEEDASWPDIFGDHRYGRRYDPAVLGFDFTADSGTYCAIETFNYQYTLSGCHTRFSRYDTQGSRLTDILLGDLEFLTAELDPDPPHYAHLVKHFVPGLTPVCTQFKSLTASPDHTLFATRARYLNSTISGYNPGYWYVMIFHTDGRLAAQSPPLPTNPNIYYYPSHPLPTPALAWGDDKSLACIHDYSDTLLIFSPTFVLRKQMDLSSLGTITGMAFSHAVTKDLPK